MRLSIRTKLAFALFAVLAPMVLLEAWSFDQARDRRLATTRADMAQTAAVAGLLVDRTLEDVLDLARTLAMTPDIRTLDGAGAKPFLQAVLANRANLANIVVFDRDGRQVVAAVDGAQPIRIDDRHYFQRTVTNSEAHVTGVLTGRIVKRPVVLAVAPIPDEKGVAIGLITVSLRPDVAGGRLREIELRPDQAIFAIDDQGVLGFHTGGGRVQDAPLDWSAVPAVAAARRDGVGFTEDFVSPVFGDRRLAAFARSPRHDWTVGVTWPEEQALAAVAADYRVQLVLLGLLALVSLAGVALTSRLLTSPLEALATHARALAAGDLERRAGIDTGDEIEELGTAFDRLAEALADERRRRAMFMHAITHDMKNLLVPLSASAWMIKRKGAPPGEAGEKVGERLASQVRRLDRLVSDFADAELVEAGRFGVDKRPVDLVAVAREVVEESRVALDREVSFDAPAALAASADPDRVAQVLTNFISNAAKYDSSGRPIEVRVRREDDRALLSVVDAGRGLEADEIASLFRPYRRLADHKGVAGLGLGLFICRVVAEAHGGVVETTSAGRGRGSTFTLVLPLSEAADAAVDDAANAAEARRA